MTEYYKEFYLKKPLEDLEKRKYEKLVRATREFKYVNVVRYSFYVLCILTILYGPLSAMIKDDFFEVKPILLGLFVGCVIAMIPFAFSVAIETKAAEYWKAIIKQRGSEVIRVSSSEIVYEYHDYYRHKFEENERIIIKKENIKKILYNARKNYVTIYSDQNTVSFLLCLTDEEKKCLLEQLGELSALKRSLFGSLDRETNVEGLKEYDFHAIAGFVMSITYFVILFYIFYKRYLIQMSSPIGKIPFKGISPTFAICCLNGWVLSKGLISTKYKWASVGMIITLLTFMQYFVWLYFTF